MHNWTTNQLNGLPDPPHAQTTDNNILRPPLARFFVFCQSIASTFAGRAFLAVKKGQPKATRPKANLQKSLLLPALKSLVGLTH